MAAMSLQRFGNGTKLQWHLTWVGCLPNLIRSLCNAWRTSTAGNVICHCFMLCGQSALSVGSTCLVCLPGCLVVWTGLTGWSCLVCLPVLLGWVYWCYHAIMLSCMHACMSGSSMGCRWQQEHNVVRHAFPQIAQGEIHHVHRCSLHLNQCGCFCFFGDKV